MKIAFLGKMGSGKSTFAGLLVIKHGYIKLSFAAKVKSIAVDLFRMNPNKKDREILQGIGMKMREIRENVWVDYLLEKINSFSYGSNIVIDDCRFINEVQALKEKGFIIIGLIPNEQRRMDTLKRLYGDITEEQLNDSSESQVMEAMNEADYIFMEHAENSIEKNYNVLKEIIGE